jgi:hypothetical protein
MRGRMATGPRLALPAPEPDRAVRAPTYHPIIQHQHALDKALVRGRIAARVK